MIGNMSKVINISNKQGILKGFLLSKNMLISSVSKFNSYWEPSSFFPNKYNHYQRKFATCMLCNSPALLGYKLLDRSRLHPLYLSNNSLRTYYCTLLKDWPKKHSIQESQKRYKSKKTLKRPEYDSDSDEEDVDYEGLSKATKPVTLRVQSLRVDGLLKKALGIARNKVETAFYEGNIRVNGTKPTKKSYQVRVGDEVDLIKGVSPMNPNFLMISRVEVLSVKEDPDAEEENLLVKLRRTKTMYIENYETTPWKNSSANSSE